MKQLIFPHWGDRQQGYEIVATNWIVIEFKWYNWLFIDRERITP